MPVSSARRLHTRAATPVARLLLLALACASLSCASVSQLARRSEKARLEGHYERAYELALDAIRKDPAAPAGRSALDEAVWALLEREKRAIRGLAAAGDTMGAADRTLELDRLRERLDRDRTPVPPDSAFAADERRVRQAGAARHYDLGQRSLDERRPKEAYFRFVSARELVPGFRDLDTIIPRTWERAITRVAVMPFNDEAGIPGVAQPFTEALWLRLSRRVKPAEFTFTRLVPPSDVWARLPVAELGRLDRGRAIAIGRALGAQRVVFGRIWNLRSDTDTERWRESIWHPVTEKDTSGKDRELWVEVPFAAVSRVRTVHVEVDFEVLDTDEEEILDRRGVPFDVIARTAYAHQQVDGDCDDYRLVPPSLERTDRERAGRIAARWKDQFGPWTLPQLLEQARRRSGGGRYTSDMRRQFWPYREQRVFLDDLPPAEDLATLAIEDIWGPVLESLRALDPQ